MAQPTSKRVERAAKALPITVATVLEAQLASDPDRPAVVARHGRLSYGELDDAANRAAHVLKAIGVRQGDRVAACLPNDIDIVVAFHGALRLGAVWVGVNSALAPFEKAFILRDAGASVLLCDAPTAAQLETVPAESGLRIMVVEPGDPNDEWTGALSGADGAPRPTVAVGPLEPAGIAYTSGTTGVPKGVVHSHHNLLLPGASTVMARGYGPTLRKGDCLPLTILNLMVLSTLLVAQAGGCCVIMDRRDPLGIARWIAEEGVTVWNGVPAMLHGLIDYPDISAAELRSLQEVWVGGSDFPEQLRQRFSVSYDIPVCATYGLTEIPTLVSIEPLGARHVPQSSGRVLPHLEVHVLDEQGGPVPAGAVGEICVGPTAVGPWAGLYRPMLGYWHDADATDRVLSGGVVHTGDIGSVDTHGNVFVRDRRTLVIIRGGANVYPAEVERVVYAFPGVVGCAVVGVPDERLGERVVAAVQIEPGATVTGEDLSGFCQEQLARYKIPDRFVFLDGLPRNSMGKVQRADIGDLVERAMWEDGAGP
ncbi:MAG: class I adenylate-forming enzyme family protein [Acidimicrobiales bacterium]